MLSKSAQYHNRKIVRLTAQTVERNCIRYGLLVRGAPSMSQSQATKSNIDAGDRNKIFLTNALALLGLDQGSPRLAPELLSLSACSAWEL